MTWVVRQSVSNYVSQCLQCLSGFVHYNNGQSGYGRQALVSQFDAQDEVVEAANADVSPELYGVSQFKGQHL